MLVLLAITLGHVLYYHKLPESLLLLKKKKKKKKKKTAGKNPWALVPSRFVNPGGVPGWPNPTLPVEKKKKKKKHTPKKKIKKWKPS